MAGLVHLADAGIADSALGRDGTVDALAAAGSDPALPPVHYWRAGRLVRVARWSAAGGAWSEPDGVRATLSLADGQLAVDGRPTVHASAAPADLVNAFALPVDAAPGARTWLTTTGLWFRDTFTPS